MANNKTKNSENSYYGWIFVIAVIAVYVYNKFGLDKWISYGPNGWNINVDPHIFNISATIGYLLLAIVGGILLLVVSLKMIQALRKQKVKVISIEFQDQLKVDAKKVEKMALSMKSFYHTKWYKRLLFKRIWIKWRITRNAEGMYHFNAIAPYKRADELKNKIRLAFPDAIVQETEGYFGITFLAKDRGRGGHMKFESGDKGYGLNTQLQNNIGNMIAMMKPNTVLELRFSPTKIAGIRESSQETAEEIEEKKKKSKVDRKKVAELHDRYYGRVAFDVAMFMYSRDHEIHPLAAQIDAYTAGENNKLKLVQYATWAATFEKLLQKMPTALKKKTKKLERWFRPLKLLVQWRNLINWKIDAPLPWRKMTWNDLELAQFLMLPELDHPVCEYIKVKVKKKKPKNGQLTRGYRWGAVDHPEAKGRDLRIPIQIMVNHGIIGGMAGSGKSAVIHSFLTSFTKEWLNDTKWAPGITICDPHQSAEELYLNFLLHLENQNIEIPWNRIRVFHVGETGYPMPLNILYKFPHDSIDAIAGETVEIILNAFEGNLTKSQDYLEKAIHTLLWNPGNNLTILDIYRVFKANEEEFRNELIQKDQLKNPFIRNWWLNTALPKMEPKTEDGPGQDINVEAIDVRLSRFLNKQSMQRIFAQKNNVLNVKQVLEEGHIVLISFKDCPDEAFRLTAGWLTNRYFRESQARGISGRPHLLVFDEVQKFNIPKIFTKILCENRKFNLGLILATQQPEKLDPDLIAALKTNAAFAIALKQGPDGAKPMSEILRNEFTPIQLMNLNNRVKEKIGNKEKVIGMEAAVYTTEGAANMIVPPPAYLFNGEPTDQYSLEERKAVEEANRLFLELQKRESPPAEEVDRMLDEALDVPDPVPRSFGKPQTKEERKATEEEELYRQAVLLVLEHQKATQALLQKELKIGVPKAQQLIQRMEEEKIVGERHGNRARQVLMTKEQYLSNLEKMQCKNM